MNQSCWAYLISASSGLDCNSQDDSVTMHWWDPEPYYIASYLQEVWPGRVLFSGRTDRCHLPDHSEIVSTAYVHLLISRFMRSYRQAHWAQCQVPQCNLTAGGLFQQNTRWGRRPYETFPLISLWCPKVSIVMWISPVEQVCILLLEELYIDTSFISLELL